MKMGAKGSWQWGVGVAIATVIGTLEYIGAHCCAPDVRAAGSSVLATLSGALWSVSAALPIRSATGRWLGISAAATAVLAGICLLP